MLPNFLIIGPPRTGTTSVHCWLQQHPDIYMSPNPKEPSYFAFPDGSKSDPFPHPDNYIRTWDEYAALFSNVTGKRIVGESSTLYFQTEDAPARIIDRLGPIKLLVLVRSPVDRAFSSFALHRSTFDEPATTFREAIAAWPARREQGWRVNWDYVTPGFYARHLENFYRCFPPDSIKVVLFDRLRSEPAGVMKDITEFLGVDDSFVFDTSTVHNASHVPRSDAMSSAVAKYLRRFAEGTQNIPDFLRKPITSRIKNVVMEHPEIAEDDRQRLIEIYEPDILKLEAMIGADLSSWYEPAERSAGAARAVGDRPAAKGPQRTDIERGASEIERGLA